MERCIIPLQKMITWGKNLWKERKNGRKLTFKMGCNFENFKIFVKTKFASKVSMFEKTLGFNQAIIIYYGRQKTIILEHNIVPRPKCGLLQRQSHHAWTLWSWHVLWTNFIVIVIVQCFNYCHFLNYQVVN